MLVWEVLLLGLYHWPASGDNPWGGFRNGSTYVNAIYREGFSIYPVQNEFGTTGTYGFDKPRILVLGDSFTTGLELMPDRGYVAQLGARHPETYFVNAGLLGASVPDYILYAPYLEHVKPTFVIIQINHDDLTTNPLQQWNRNLFLHENGSLTIATNPLYAVDQKPSPFLAPSYLIPQSTVIHVLSTRLDKFARNTKSLPAPVEGPLETYHIAKQVRLLKQVYGNKIAFLYVPNQPSLYQDQLYVDPTLTRREALRSYVESEGAGFIDLTDPFLQYYHDTKQFPFGFSNSIMGNGHWNKAGNTMAADAVEKYLQTHGELS